MPNMALGRPAGSHSLAGAAHCRRSALMVTTLRRSEEA